MIGVHHQYLFRTANQETLMKEIFIVDEFETIPSPNKIRPTVIDKSKANTNRIKLRCPIIILPVHGSPDGKMLPWDRILSTPPALSTGCARVV